MRGGILSIIPTRTIKEKKNQIQKTQNRFLQNLSGVAILNQRETNLGKKLIFDVFMALLILAYLADFL